MTVAEAQRKVSVVEFLEWVAFESVEPGEPTRGDARAALIAMTIANVYRDPKRKPQPFTLKDFMLRTEAERADIDKQKDIRTKLEVWRRMYAVNKKKIDDRRNALEARRKGQVQKGVKPPGKGAKGPSKPV